MKIFGSLLTTSHYRQSVPSIVIVVPYGMEVSGLVIFASRLEREFRRQNLRVRLIIRKSFVSIVKPENGTFLDADQINYHLIEMQGEYDILLWFGFHQDIEDIRKQIYTSIELRSNFNKKVYFIWERTGETSAIPDSELVSLLATKGTDGIIALNTEQAEQLHSMKILPDIIHLLSPGIDTTSIFTPSGSALSRQKNRQELGWEDNEVIVLAIGRLVKRKRLDWLLKTWLSDSNLQKNAKLVVVGAFYGTEPETEALIQSLSSNQKGVCLIPFEDGLDRTTLYQSADIFIVPSVYEGEPSVLSEAMACGLPIIASSISGHQFLVRERLSGILFKPDNPIELCLTLHSLINHPLDRKRLGQNARELAVKERDISVIAQRFLSVFSEH